MTTKYQMWLTYNAEKSKIQIPVLPETFDIKNGSNNNSVDIVGLGEITIMQSRPALQFSFSSFFPSTKFPGLKVSKITKPLKLVKKINKWKSGKKPVHFICTSLGIDLYCTIEHFNYSESGGDVGTINYSITLKEYREITVRKIKVKKKKKKGVFTASTTKRVNNKTQAKTYTVKKGDCLYNIAKSQLGDSSRWKEIYKLNKKVIGGNPNLIYPGQVFTLPS